MVHHACLTQRSTRRTKGDVGMCIGAWLAIRFIFGVIDSAERGPLDQPLPVAGGGGGARACMLSRGKCSASELGSQRWCARERLLCRLSDRRKHDGKRLTTAAYSPADNSRSHNHPECRGNIGPHRAGTLAAVPGCPGDPRTGQKQASTRRSATVTERTNTVSCCPRPLVCVPHDGR